MKEYDVIVIGCGFESPTPAEKNAPPSSKITLIIEYCNNKGGQNEEVF